MSDMLPSIDAALFASLPFPAVIYDSDQMLVKANGAFVARVGQSEHDVVGQPFGNFVELGDMQSLDTAHASGYMQTAQGRVPVFLSLAPIGKETLVVCQATNLQQAYIKDRLEQVLPVLEQLSLGNFAVSIDIPEEEDAFSEHFAAINLMIHDFNQMVTDIQAKRAELEQAKIDLEQRYKERTAELETISEGIVITDAHALISYVNPAFAQMVGYGVQELVQHEFAEVIKGFDGKGNAIPPSRMSDAAAITEINPMTNLEIMTQSGEHLPVRMSASAINVQHQFAGVVRVLHDYSKEREIETQKDDFFAMASHEMRTPLTVIAANLDNVLHGMGGTALTEKDHQMLSNSLSASERLMEMVENFLQVSRIDQGMLQVEREAVHMCDITNSVIEELSSFAASKHLNLVHTCGSPAPHVWGDRSLIRHILVNLIGNSLKFTKEGMVQVSHRQDGNYIVTEIRDTGIGIDPELHEKLFHRFQQAMEDGTERDAGGTGLGLYISRAFAETMGGNVELVHSAPGEGSVFGIRLELASEG